MLPSFFAIACLMIVPGDGQTVGYASGVKPGPQQFADAVNDLMNNLLGYDELENYYKTLSFKRMTLKGETIIRKMADDFGQKFLVRSNVLKDLRKVVEESLTIESVLPECCNLNESSLEISTKFKQPIGKGACTRISSSTAEHFGYLSQNFSDAAEKNLAQKPFLTWQYFTSESGITTTHPSVGVNGCGQYDGRYRPWYVQANAPEPKDLVIAIDVGQAMSAMHHGKTLLTIAKQTAKAIVGTLNPHDRVAIVGFSDNIIPLETGVDANTCFDNQLAKATAENIGKFEEYIDKLEVQEQSYYAVALEKSMDYFEMNPTTDGRDQVILFLSAGMPDEQEIYEAADIFDTLMARIEDLGKPVVLMTFGFGAGDFTLLQRMAEQNGSVYEVPPNTDFKTTGLFIHVVGSTDLIPELGPYYSFFSNRTSKQEFLEPIWSLPYVDGWGLGLLLSASLPVYNGGGDLAGVVATDVTLDDLLSDAVYFSHRPESAYIFIIDSYGYVLYHPFFKYPEDGEIAFVDISAFELDANIAGVIDEMKRGLSGAIAVDTTSIQGNVVKKVTKEAHFKQISNSNFSICVVLVEGEEEILLENVALDGNEEFRYHRLDLVPSSKPCQLFNHYMSEKATVMFAPRAYSDPDAYLSSAETVDGIKDLEEYVATGEVNSILKPAIRDATLASQRAERFWNTTDDEMDKYVLWRYFGTKEGVMRIQPGLQLPSNYDPTLRPWYRAAIENKGKAVFTRTPDHKEIFATLSKAILVENDQQVGVVGIDLLEGYIRNLVNKYIFGCNDPMAFACTLVGSTGNVLYRNKRLDSESHHLTHVEPLIAQSLLSNGIMTKTECMVMEEAKVKISYEITRTEPYEGSSSGDCFSYNIHPIPDTNVFIITRRSDVSCDESTGCKCNDTCVTGPDGCECPCWSRYDGYDTCRNVFDIESSETLPKACPVPGPPMPAIEDDLEITDLPQCKEIDYEEHETTTDEPSDMTNFQTKMPRTEATKEAEKYSIDMPATIAGSIVAGVCFILLIVVAVVHCIKQRKST